jgi:PD-(D/E)XK nuclease superfamily
MPDPFIEQLAELCRAQPTRAKWVFVPTHAVGRTLGDRLAIEGTDWANLRFVTPLDIALRMGAPFLVERGIDPSEEGLGPALIMRLLLGLPEQPEGGYFRHLADQPSMGQALWLTIRELRMAGVKAADIQLGAFASRAKHAELRALLEAYETFLSNQKRGDMAAVYEEAVLHPDWCPIQSQDCWTELPHENWAPLQRRVLGVLPGDHLLPRALDLPGATIPRRLRESTVERVTPDPAKSPLAFLMAPQKSGPLELFHAGGRDAEIEEVFRRVLLSGATVDQVEVACASDVYPPLVWEKALRYDWKVTAGPGIGASQARPGRALLGLCAWIESDFSAGVMRRLLQSGDVRLAIDVSSGEAARLLVKSEAGWGRATYSVSFTRLAGIYTIVAADPDRSDERRASAAAKIVQIDTLLGWFQQLLASIPEPDADRQVDLESVVAASIAYLEASAARTNALDAVAVAALKDSVSELRALDAFRCPLPVALRFIRERVEGLTVGRDRARPGHLHISSLSDAGFSHRRHLFVVGLEEGRVFPAAVEDPVLLDAERETIDPALRRSSDRTEEAVWSVLSRLATLGGGTSITLSYSCRDTREYRETFPSWLMLQAYRVLTGDSAQSYPGLKTALGTPRSHVPESPIHASSDAAWWLASLAAWGTDAAVLEAFPSLAKGRLADDSRNSNSFGAYDGYVPEAGPVLDPCAHEQAVSATQLEHAAKCPFRHFLERGLGLSPIEDDERDADVWLDPLTRGSEMHDFYALVMRRCRDQNRRADLVKDRDWLAGCARERLGVLRREMPPPSEEVFDREAQDFMADLELFLRAESEVESGRTPIAFEVSFGQTLAAGEPEALAQAEPVLIDLGNGLRFRLRGRIDRIDQIGADAFEIVDYKTGGYFAEAWKGTFAGGSMLQHALYGLAAVELLKRTHQHASITAGTYYFSSVKGRQERRSIARPTSDALTAVLSDLRRVIAKGTFVHAPAECKWCDFARACGSKVFEQAAGKLSDPKLEDYRRLVAYE